MGIFTRKKKIGASDLVSLIQGLTSSFTAFGTNITKSDVVRICIDRIASQCAKLKPRYIKKLDNNTISEKSGKLSFILQHKPNPLMTPYHFIYKTISLLLLNENAFVYPMYDKNTYEIKGLYPLRPTIVEPVEMNDGSLFLKFFFEDGANYMLPYENVIHLKLFYGVNDIFGGLSSKGDHEALLKTIQINDNVLQGVDNAIRSSFQIKGLLKMNGMLSDKDKEKQLDSFNEMLNVAVNKKGSSIMPMDLKSEYVPLETDPKIVNKDVLDFLQSKILDYFGVSVPIFTNKYTEIDFNSFYESTIEPLAIQLSEAFTNGLLTNNEIERGEEIIFYSERLQYASWNTKVQAIEKLMGLGIMSLNESRGLLGLEPVDGGDKRLQSLNYVDASKANEYQLKKKTEEINEDESKD